MNYLVKDYVSTATSNADGCRFLCAIDSEIAAGHPVEISFEGVLVVTSSFLNSFLGELFDKYGFDNVKGLIRFTNLEIANANTLKRFVEAYLELQRSR